MISIELPQFKKIENMTKDIPNCISFAQGTLRTGGVPEEIRRYAREILLTDKADYYTHTLGIKELREKLALILSRDNNTKIDFSQIVVTHGAMGGIITICLSLVDQGDDIILPEPTYPVYKDIVKFCRANAVFVPAFFEKQKGEKRYWEFDCDRVINSITPKTKMIILPNPSNPTGTCLTSQDIKSLVDTCNNRGIYLLSDEVYENYVFEDSFNSVTRYIPESEFIIRAGSFSKNFAMSGWRVGYIVSSLKYTDVFSAVQSGTVCCPNAIAQYAALYALDHKELMNEQIQKVKIGRELSYRLLSPLEKADVLSLSQGHAGFYLFPKTCEKSSKELAFDLLNKEHVAISPGIDFGPSFGSYFRLCFAREPHVVQEGCKRIVNYFQNRYNISKDIFGQVNV
jgi:aspartate/methionine/tyrosine aminotransferase